MKKIFFNIRWQMLFVCVFLSATPIIALGYFSYKIHEKEAFINNEKSLRFIAHDWHVTTMSYIEQKERVLKGEEFLAKRRLEAIVLNIKKMAELSSGQSDGLKENDINAGLAEKVKTVDVGRKGFIFLFKNEKIDNVFQNNWIYGDNIWNDIDEEGNYYARDIVAIARQLNGDNTFVKDYYWIDPATGEKNHMLAISAYYQPNDIVIAAVSNYTDFLSNELEGILKNDLRKKMAAQKIGDNGYIWVINSQGEHIVSKAGERDGENIFNLQQNGVYVAREIIKRAHQMKGDEMFTYYYSWKNLKDDESQKVSAASYVPEWDWIIGASAYHKDFLSGLAHIKRYIKTVVGIAIIASIFISIFFTHFIMMPVKKLDEITKQAAFGNLDVSVGEKLIEKSGEVGSLARSFRIMIFNLKKRIEETEKSKRELENGNKSLSVAKEELESKNRELEKFNKLVVDREMEMIKLKKKIKELQQDQ